MIWHIQQMKKKGLSTMQFIFWKKTANYVWDHSRVAIEKKKEPK